MPMNLRRRTMLALACAGTLTPLAPAFGQEKYPAKPLNLIVPFGPGAASDNVARILGEGLSRQVGQPVIATNKPGANGMIAIRTAQAAPADGYTVMFMANGVVIEQVMKKTSFDIRRDLIPVARVVQAPLGLFASNHLPANTVGEFIDYARKNPGKVNFASTGIGSVAHLTTERLRLATGLDMVHVPYPAGTAPVLTALMAGDVGVYVNEMGSMKGFVAEKKVKLLATLSGQRSPIYPDAPAIAETGVPELQDFDAAFFFGIFVQPGTPPERVEFLNRAVNRTLEDPAVRARLTPLGYSPANIGGMSPAQFRQMMNEELARVETTVRAGNIPTGQQ